MKSKEEIKLKIEIIHCEIDDLIVLEDNEESFMKSLDIKVSIAHKRHEDRLLQWVLE